MYLRVTDKVILGHITNWYDQKKTCNGTCKQICGCLTNKQENKERYKNKDDTIYEKQYSYFCLPWYAADQNPAAAENAVAEEWWCICCWFEEDLGDVSLLFILPISRLQPPTMLLDKAPSEPHEVFDVITLFPLLDPLAVLMLILLFVTFPLQSSADTVYKFGKNDNDVY